MVSGEYGGTGGTGTTRYYYGTSSTRVPPAGTIPAVPRVTIKIVHDVYL